LFFLFACYGRRSALIARRSIWASQTIRSSRSNSIRFQSRCSPLKDAHVTVRQRIELETSINQFLYLVPNYDLLWFVADKLNCKRAVYFGLFKDFLQETLALPAAVQRRAGRGAN
jgi:hypothetical protein